MKIKNLFLFAMSCGLLTSMTSCNSEEPAPIPVGPTDAIEMTMPENSEVRTVKVKMPNEMKTRASVSMNDWLYRLDKAKIQNYQVQVAVYVDHNAGTESGYHLYWDTSFVVDKDATSFDIKVPHPCDLTENGVKLMVFARPTIPELVGYTAYSMNLREKELWLMGGNTNRKLSSLMSAGMDCFMFYDLIPDGETFEITLKRPLKQYLVMSSEPIDNPAVMHDMLDNEHSGYNNLCTDLVFTDTESSEEMFYPYVWNFDTGEVRYQKLTSINSHFYSFFYNRQQDEIYYTTNLNGKEYAILGSFFTFASDLNGETADETYDTSGNAIRIMNMRLIIVQEHGD